MANTNIAELPVAIGLTGAEQVPIVQAGVTKRASASLFDFTGGSGGSTQAANTVLAGPTSGGAAAPTFRALINADLPVVSIAKGGTGQTTQTTGFDALAPTTTRGDLIYRNATVNTRLALGTSGYQLQSNGTDAVWAGFLQSGTGAVTRTWNAKVADIFHIKDFGAAFDNSTNDNTAWTNAFAALTANGGGRLLLPFGTSRVTTALTPPSNVEIVGPGYSCTVNFAGQVSGNGFYVNGVNHVLLKGFLIRNSFGDGLAINNASFIDTDELDVGFSGGNGISLTTANTCNFNNTQARNSTGANLRSFGYCDQITFTRGVFGANSVTDGARLDSMTATVFTACDFGLNAGYGVNGTNLWGVVFNGCDFESNTLGAAVFSASTAIAGSSLTPDIRGVVFNGGAAYTNGTTGPSFLELSSVNSKTVDITLNGFVDGSSPSGMSIRGNGVSAVKMTGGYYAGTFSLTGSATINTLLNTTPATNMLPYFDSTSTSTTTSLTALGRAVIGLSTLTNHGILLGQAGSALVATAAMTDGQLLVGQTSADPLPKTLSGDATLSAAGALTLASTVVAGGPTGSATVAPIITYDAKGRLTAVSSATITPAASSITGGQALSKVDDTNVTLTLGGAPTTALLAAASLTLGWTGQLAASRGGTGISALGTGVATALGVNVGSAGAFVTFNGALGTPSSGTLTSATGLPIVAGTTGTLSIARGGTNQTAFSTNGVVYHDGTSQQAGTVLTFDGTTLSIVGTTTNHFAVRGGTGAGQGPYMFFTDSTPQNIGIFGKEAVVLGSGTAANFWVSSYVGDLVLATNSTESFRIDRTSGGQIKLAAVQIAANGTVATGMTNLGPAGSHTTIQEWWVVQNASGTVRYIPMF